MPSNNRAENHCAQALAPAPAPTHNAQTPPPEGGTAHEAEMRLRPGLSPYIVPKSPEALHEIAAIYGLKLKSLDDWQRLADRTKLKIQRELIAREHSRLTGNDPASELWRFEASLTIDGVTLNFRPEVSICTNQESDLVEIRLDQNQFPGERIVEAIWQFQEAHGIPLTAQHMHQLQLVPRRWLEARTPLEIAADAVALWDRAIDLETLLHAVSIVEPGDSIYGGISWKGTSGTFSFHPLHASQFLELGHLLGLNYPSSENRQRIFGWMALRLPRLRAAYQTGLMRKTLKIANEAYTNPGYFGGEHRYINAKRDRRQTLTLIAAATRAMPSESNTKPDDAIAVFSRLKSFLPEDDRFASEIARFESRYRQVTKSEESTIDLADPTFLETFKWGRDPEMNLDLMGRFVLEMAPIKSKDHEDLDLSTQDLGTSFIHYLSRRLGPASEKPRRYPEVEDALRLWAYKYFYLETFPKNSLEYDSDSTFREDVTHHYLFHRWADDDRLFGGKDQELETRKRIAQLQYDAIVKLNALLKTHRHSMPHLLAGSHQVVRGFLLDSSLYERLLRRFGIDFHEFSAWGAGRQAPPPENH